MYLVSVWNEETVQIDVYKDQLVLAHYFPGELQQWFTLSSIVNGTAMLRPEEKGSKTEIAMLLFAEKCGINYEKERSKS